MEELITKYGYFAVFIGTLVEGGSLLCMAGFLAHQGYLMFIPWVILAGFCGNFLDTLICYLIGRRGGKAIETKKPGWGARIENLHTWLERYQTLTVIGVRFVPGFRTAGAVAIGIARVPPARFVLLNVLGALLWAITIGISGYLFGHLLQGIMDDIKHLEVPILLGILVAGLVTWAGSRLLACRRTRRARGTPLP
jgi:membrane protein DedA with SNARE-associated domain